MKFARRLTFYLGGFAIGLIFLFFFLGGKRASCDYGPEARTLKNLRTKERVYTDLAIEQLYALQIDSTNLDTLFFSGGVLFSESNTRLDSCKEYTIKGKVLDKVLKMLVANCSEQAKILQVIPEN